MSRRALRRVVLAGAGVVAGALVLSSCLTSPRDDAEFFRAGGNHGPVLVVAHQGGELVRPSNTMEAFRHAVDLGVDVLDTDLHRTADGVLVLLHDETVDRTSNGTGAVRDLTIEELRELDFGYRFTTVAEPGDEGGQSDAGDEGVAGPHPWRGRGLGIVTVDELFASFGTEVRYGIEIKQTVPAAAEELCTAITDAGLVDHVLVSSFAQPNMDAFRAACPQVATSATEGEVRRFYVLARLRLGGFDTPDHDALQIPQYVGRWHLLSGRVRDAAADWNLPIVPWTIDDPETMARLIDDGVAGINTNRPDLLIELLDGTAG